MVIRSVEKRKIIAENYRDAMGVCNDQTRS